LKSDRPHSFLEFGAKSGKKFIKISQKNAKFDEEIENREIQLFNREKVLAIFDEKIEIRERCKGVHCVDLGESFPTTIYLQKSASIQPRTSPSKFGGKYSILFNRVLTRFPASCTAGCVAGCPENCTLSARPCPHQLSRVARGPPITRWHKPRISRSWAKDKRREDSGQPNRGSQN
jgi:hypothetical protein